MKPKLAPASSEYYGGRRLVLLQKREAWKTTSDMEYSSMFLSGMRYAWQVISCYVGNDLILLEQPGEQASPERVHDLAFIRCYQKVVGISNVIDLT